LAPDIINSTKKSFIDRLPHRLIVPALLCISATLAVTSLIGDSITYDETSHLTSGYSYLGSGDFRFSPDNPPLGKMWAALPLLFIENNWPGPQTDGFSEGNQWKTGRLWLFELNDGEKLLTVGRCMMVILLVVTCLCVYVTARVLFGPRAALLSVILAVFSPTLLAHGRLVTTDLPLTLFALLAIIALDRLLEHISPLRLILFALAVSAVSLSKFSWLMVLPSLAIMCGVAVFGRKPISLQIKTVGKKAGKTKLLTSIKSRTAAVVVCAVLTVIFVWAAIWCCYGLRYSPFSGPDKAQARMLTSRQPMPKTMQQAWEMTLTDASGRPTKGIAADLIRKARRRRLLPEAYLYGMAYIQQCMGNNESYFLGNISNTGWHCYMPVAFVIKTPIAIMLLLSVAVYAIFTGRVSIKRKPLLTTGLLSFTIIYTLTAIISKYSIGHRHLLPIYPALMVFAGASACLMDSRRIKWLVLAAVVWLAGANLWIYPHYLSYFNELIGGPGRGHLYLADSNIDWGQDIKRLAKYAEAHPDEKIKLAYFGSGDPSKYGFECENLRSTAAFGLPAELAAGTYVISATQLLGVYDPFVTDNFWNNPYNLVRYQLMLDSVARPPGEGATEQQRQQKLLIGRQLKHMQKAVVINMLRRRQPDERIGYSLFVYRLSQTDVDKLIRAYGNNL